MAPVAEPIPRPVKPSRHSDAPRADQNNFHDSSERRHGFSVPRERNVCNWSNADTTPMSGMGGKRTFCVRSANVIYINAVW